MLKKATLILSDSQDGFRNAKSTFLALVDLVEKLTTDIDNKLVTIGFFIDLKQMFDTIDHSLLIKN